MKRIFFTAAAFFIFLAIVYLSLTPRPVTLPVSNSDKIEHALAYAVFALFLALSLKSWGFGSRRIIIALILCAAVGGGLEFIQPFFGRTKDIQDFFADMAGAVIGSIAVGTGS